MTGQISSVSEVKFKSFQSINISNEVSFSASVIINEFNMIIYINLNYFN